MAIVDHDQVGDDGMISNVSDNETIHDVIAARLSRRSVLGGGMVAAGTAMFGVEALLRSVPVAAHDRRRRPVLGFDGIPVSAADAVVVPEGYTARVLISWGGPLSDGPAFRQDASNSAADQAKQWGMHNDGVVFFPMSRGGRYEDDDDRRRGGDRGLLVQNHEYTDDVLLFPDGTANWTAEKTAKSQNAYGVSVIELRKVKLRGPRRGHDRDADRAAVPLRGAPLRVGDRDRPVRPPVDPGQAHRPGAPQARR